ncbi:hypothetical protein Dimus_013365 [Dionaea muscipula]
MHVAACKEFYKNLTMSISEKKEVTRSCVRGVKIELDGMILAGILGVPGNNGICENRRRDDEDEAPAENVQNEEVANEGQNNQEDFDWEAAIDEVEIQREEMEKEAEIQGESGSDDKFYDAEVEVEEPTDVIVEAQAMPASPVSPTDSTNVQ